jgi:hypothetical protein
MTLVKNRIGTEPGRVCLRCSGSMYAPFAEGCAHAYTIEELAPEPDVERVCLVHKPRALGPSLLIRDRSETVYRASSEELQLQVKHPTEAGARRLFAERWVWGHALVALFRWLCRPFRGIQAGAIVRSATDPRRRGRVTGYYRHREGMYPVMWADGTFDRAVPRAALIVTHPDHRAFCGGCPDCASLRAEEQRFYATQAEFVAAVDDEIERAILGDLTQYEEDGQLTTESMRAIENTVDSMRATAVFGTEGESVAELAARLFDRPRREGDADITHGPGVRPWEHGDTLPDPRDVLIHGRLVVRRKVDCRCGANAWASLPQFGVAGWYVCTACRTAEPDPRDPLATVPEALRAFEVHRRGCVVRSDLGTQCLCGSVRWIVSDPLPPRSPIDARCADEACVIAMVIDRDRIGIGFEEHDADEKDESRVMWAAGLLSNAIRDRHAKTARAARFLGQALRGREVWMGNLRCACTAGFMRFHADRGIAGAFECVNCGRFLAATTIADRLRELRVWEPAPVEAGVAVATGMAAAALHDSPAGERTERERGALIAKATSDARRQLGETALEHRARLGGVPLVSREASAEVDERDEEPLSLLGRRVREVLPGGTLGPVCGWVWLSRYSADDRHLYTVRWDTGCETEEPAEALVAIDDEADHG